MDKRAVVGIVTFLLVAAGVVLVWQKSQVKPVITPKPEVTNTEIKKVDLTTQPAWVQKLKVAGKKGRSANGLDNFTLSVAGIETSSLTYVLQYQTANKGMQGALAMSPQSVTKGSFTKVIDLGTCSTKSCVRHDGVTSIDVELDFDDSSVWTGTISLN